MSAQVPRAVLGALPPAVVVHTDEARVMPVARSATPLWVPMTTAAGGAASPPDDAAAVGDPATAVVLLAGLISALSPSRGCKTSSDSRPPQYALMAIDARASAQAAASALVLADPDGGSGCTVAPAALPSPDHCSPTASASGLGESASPDGLMVRQIDFHRFTEGVSVLADAPPASAGAGAATLTTGDEGSSLVRFSGRCGFGFGGRGSAPTGRDCPEPSPAPNRPAESGLSLAEATDAGESASTSPDTWGEARY
mmetsp:Transcript_15040/g.38668  ORF Transcript_15040/g.38668 Transcript_15040/m.38668 type:complete len:255 (-) Transcript_15040:42-806(-)